MRLWIDADACPRPVRDLICRAAERKQLAAVFVSNGALTVPRSPLLSTVRVKPGLDVADQHIAANAEKGDLAITADIPLAAELVRKGVRVIDPRGETLDEDNVSERLAVRDLMKELRDAGTVTGGPSSFGAREAQAFANALDRALNQR